MIGLKILGGSPHKMDSLRKQFTVSLPVDLEDAKRRMRDYNFAYSKKLLAEREHRYDANMLAILNNQPMPYPFPEGMFDDDNTCPECGQPIDNKETD